MNKLSHWITSFLSIFKFKCRHPDLKVNVEMDNYSIAITSSCDKCGYAKRELL